MLINEIIKSEYTKYAELRIRCKKILVVVYAQCSNFVSPVGL